MAESEGRFEEGAAGGEAFGRVGGELLPEPPQWRFDGEFTGREGVRGVAAAELFANILPGSEIPAKGGASEAASTSLREVIERVSCGSLRQKKVTGLPK